MSLSPSLSISPSSARNLLSVLQKREHDLDTALDDLLGARQNGECRSAALARVVPCGSFGSILPSSDGTIGQGEQEGNDEGRGKKKMDKAMKEVEALNQQLETAAALAKNITARVRELDGARERLQGVMERVELSMDVRNSLERVKEAMREKKWEDAAGNFYRILHKRGMQNRQDEASQSMLALEQQYKEMLREELEKIDLSDLTNSKRALSLCKLFPLVDLPFEGLVKYCATLMKAFRFDLSKNGLLLELIPQNAKIPFLDLITNILDRLNALIAAHAPIIEKAFGYNAVTKFLQCVQLECDLLLHPFLEKFVGDRKIGQTLSTVQQYNKNFERKEPSVDTLKLDGLLDEISFLIREGELFDRDLRESAKRASSKAIQETGELQDRECKILEAMKATYLIAFLYL